MATTLAARSINLLAKLEPGWAAEEVGRAPTPWLPLAVPRAELDLAAVLPSGQAFRWRASGGVWSCCLHNRVLRLRQTEHELWYCSEGPGTALSDEALVRDYFNLGVRVADLYEQWSARDARFGALRARLRGVRVLRQDPWETLCAFICSSNNNVKRISGMVAALATEFGPAVPTREGTFHDFPAPAALAQPGVEERLRALGFGYRARYIAATAQAMAAKGADYLHALRDADVATATAALREFAGVGPKVADCVALMSLDKHSVVPVDTHMFKIAARDYKMKVPAGAKAYEAVQAMFAALWGEHAGWAHSVLFTRDLGAAEPALAETVETETVKTETVETETVKTETVETETVKTEKVETDSFTATETVVAGRGLKTETGSLRRARARVDRAAKRVKVEA